MNTSFDKWLFPPVLLGFVNKYGNGTRIVPHKSTRPANSSKFTACSVSSRRLHWITEQEPVEWSDDSSFVPQSVGSSDSPVSVTRDVCRCIHNGSWDSQTLRQMIASMTNYTLHQSGFIWKHNTNNKKKVTTKDSHALKSKQHTFTAIIAKQICLVKKLSYFSWLLIAEIKNETFRFSLRNGKHCKERVSYL